MSIGERDRAVPLAATLEKLASVLNVTTDYLIGRDKGIKKEASGQATESPRDLFAELESNVGTKTYKTIMIPVYNEESCCRKGFTYCGGDETPKAETFIPFAIPPAGQGANGRVIGVIARDNSMINAGIRDGSIVYLAHDSEIYDRQPAGVCIGVEQKFMIRCIIRKPDGTIVLRAKNPDYPDEIITQEDLEAGWYREIGPVIGIYAKPEWA